jgi:hypothetical protein
MFEPKTLDALRSGALDRMERAVRLRRLALVAAALVEVVFLAAFVLLADFGNRTHLLLFLSVLALYWMLGLGLLALGAQQSRNLQIVLRMLEERGERDGPA